jgi:hypothetical protein
MDQGGNPAMTATTHAAGRNPEGDYKQTWGCRPREVEVICYRHNHSAFNGLSPHPEQPLSRPLPSLGHPLGGPRLATPTPHPEPKKPAAEQRRARSHHDPGLTSRTTAPRRTSMRTTRIDDNAQYDADVWDRAVAYAVDQETAQDRAGDFADYYMSQVSERQLRTGDLPSFSEVFSDWYANHS